MQTTRNDNGRKIVSWHGNIFFNVGSSNGESNFFDQEEIIEKKEGKREREKEEGKA